MNVFSTEVFKQKRVVSRDRLMKYSYSVGLPNLGNTCYMNSLMQALSGCSHFSQYLDRLMRHIGIDSECSDSKIVFLLIQSLKELRNGTEEAAEFMEVLHEMLCDEDSSNDSGVTFTRLYEQQDSHDLMFFLLEKITKITAKFSRKQNEQAGLTISLELLRDINQERRRVRNEADEGED